MSEDFWGISLSTNSESPSSHKNTLDVVESTTDVTKPDYNPTKYDSFGDKPVGILWIDNKVGFYDKFVRHELRKHILTGQHLFHLYEIPIERNLKLKRTVSLNRRAPTETELSEWLNTKRNYSVSLYTCHCMFFTIHLAHRDSCVVHPYFWSTRTVAFP